MGENFKEECRIIEMNYCSLSLLVEIITNVNELENVNN